MRIESRILHEYIAKAKDGQVVKGELDAQSRDKALALVSAMGLYPVSVNEGKKSLLSMPKKVGKKQISIMLRQMSSMINASIPIPVVLSVLRDDEKNPTLKEMLTHIHKDVTDGLLVGCQSRSVGCAESQGALHFSRQS